LNVAGWNGLDAILVTVSVRLERVDSEKSADLPACGLKMVVCSPSIASKKSVKALVVSAFGVSLSFEEEPSAVVGTEVDGADTGNIRMSTITFRWTKLRYLRFSSFFATVRPFFNFLSAASLAALYSILFCSKFGSFKYSSKDPTRETGACGQPVSEITGREGGDITCFKLGIGTSTIF
jgi:hypothetical protein